MPSRPRTDTIGSLGRTPARASVPPPPPPKLPTPPPEKDGTAVGRWFRDALFTNVGLKFLSFVLAVTVFLLVNTDRDREITATVGVAYTLPDDKVLVSERVEDIHITIKGPWRKLRGFDQRELDRISLDLRHANGGEIAITPDMIHLPSGLAVTSVSPRLVRVVFEKRVEKLVEVAPSVTGRPQHGYVVSEIKAEPATAKIRGAESTLRGMSSIRTRELSLEGRTDSFALDTELVPPDGVDLVSGTVVNLQVHLDEELVTRKRPGMVVALRATGFDATKLHLVPAQIDVTLTGALLAVEKVQDTMTPYVKLTAADLVGKDGKPDKDGKGTVDPKRDFVVQIDGLPPGIGVKLSPERVRVVQNPTR